MQEGADSAPFFWFIAGFREKPNFIPSLAVGASLAARSQTRIKSILITEGTGFTEEDGFPLWILYSLW
ncbi:hypothetical protein A15D_01984 [Alcanivorax sp. MD8A]|nr:hypothetical protein A15D_01984 [Alcanivorax sp. MD8A]